MLIFFYFTNTKLFSFKGATIDALKRADWTPLMLACTKTGNDAYECVAALLKAKANPFLRNKDGWTPLHLICRSGNKDAFDLLVNQFTRCIDDRTNNGRSTIHIAGNNFYAMYFNIYESKNILIPIIINSLIF